MSEHLDKWIKAQNIIDRIILIWKNLNILRLPVIFVRRRGVAENEVKIPDRQIHL